MIPHPLPLLLLPAHLVLPAAPPRLSVVLMLPVPVAALAPPLLLAVLNQPVPMLPLALPHDILVPARCARPPLAPTSELDAQCHRLKE